MPAPVASTPERSLDQRLEALQRANEIRVKRAELKKDIKAGKVSVQDILNKRPDYVGTMKVGELLKAIRKLGVRKSARLLRELRISEAKTVGGLSDRQRGELVALLDARQ